MIKDFNNYINEDFFKNKMNSTKVYDIQYPGRSSKNGWKLSILGKSMNDVEFLYDTLSNFLKKNDICFKIATLKRIQHTDYEQSKKALTIYVPDDENHLELAENVYELIMNYKGHENLKTPFKGYEHYAGAIYFRNDRDESGEYISTKKL